MMLMGSIEGLRKLIAKYGPHTTVKAAINAELAADPFRNALGTQLLKESLIVPLDPSSGFQNPIFSSLTAYLAKHRN